MATRKRIIVLNQTIPLGLKVSAANNQKMAKFIGKAGLAITRPGRPKETTVEFTRNGRKYVARVGDVITKNRDGEIRIVRKDDLKNYETI